MSTIKVGAHEAPAKLPVPPSGEAAAELLPSGSAKSPHVAAAIRQMHTFIRSHPPIPGIDTKAVIEEGRD